MSTNWTFLHRKGPFLPSLLRFSRSQNTCKGRDTSLFLAKGHKISIFSVKMLIFITEMLNRTVYQLCKRTQLFTENAASLMAEKF